MGSGKGGGWEGGIEGEAAKRGAWVAGRIQSSDNRVATGAQSGRREARMDVVHILVS